MNSKKIVVIGTDPSMLLNFREDLLKSLVCAGLLVKTLSNPLNKNQKIRLKSLGVSASSISISRNSLNIIHDIQIFIKIFFAYKKIKPDIVLSYTIKPVIWGGIASRFTKVDFYALITGLGFTFHGDSLKRRVLTSLVVFLYKISLKKSKAVIFQNKDNRDIFVNKGIVPFSKTYVVNGSGVDVAKFNVARFPKNGLRFLCISRLLGEKGLREYAEAARIVKNKFPNVEFDLVGSEDSSPDAISLNEVSNWSNYINYRGVSGDVRKHIKECHVYVLPSYHEGLPRSTLEAMSMGRPVLTTNAVGCRETIKNSVNGFMVPVKSVKKLVEMIIWFIGHSDQIEKMGLASRKMAEDRFDVRKVNEEMLKIMNIK
jgi:glycosyltransferase involved in cell wall biosynthesis